MRLAYAITKPQLATVVFLGMFIIALAMARLIVAHNSTIDMSPPIELEHLGVAISVPSGHGWRSDQQWHYREGALSVASRYAPVQGRPSAQVSCRYFAAAEALDDGARLQARAAKIGGAIAERGQIKRGRITVSWAHIGRGGGIILDVFFGTAELPQGRQLDVEVSDTIGDAELAREVFERVVDSLKVEEKGLLDIGVELVSAMKDRGVAAFLENHNRQVLFMVKDAKGRYVGFTMDVLVDSGRDVEMSIQAASVYYLKSGYVQDYATAFQSDNALSQYTWKTQGINRVGPKVVDSSSITVCFDQSGVLTVAQSDPRQVEREYRLGGSAMPNALLELFLQQVIDSNCPRCVIDLIESDGKIVPTLLTRVEDKSVTLRPDSGQPPPRDEIAYVLRLEYLDGHGFYEMVYLDAHKAISRVLIQQQELYFLERASPEDAAKVFPERADLLLQTKRP